MKVIMLESNKKGYVTDIDGSLEGMQAVVGGNIEALYCFGDLMASLICNEEGKLENLPLNRAIRDESNEIYDIIAGPAFIVGLSEENFDSLSDELIEALLPKFYYPETFMRVGGKIIAMKW